MIQGLESLLAEAWKQEAEYGWLAAFDAYAKALELAGQDSSEREKIIESQAYALYRAAFQAESGEEFRSSLRKSMNAYKEAKMLCENAREESKARGLSCQAMIAFVGFYLATEVSERRRMLDDSWQFTKEALNAFRDCGDHLTFGRTYNTLSMGADLKSQLESESEKRERPWKEAIEYGEETIKLLSNTAAKDELAKAYALTGIRIEAWGFDFLKLDQREKYSQKAAKYWVKAAELSKEVALKELSHFLSHPLTDTLEWGHGTKKALSEFEEALKHCEETGDRLMIGGILQWLGFHVYWASRAAEDPTIAKRLAEKLLEYEDKASHQLSPLSFPSIMSGDSRANYYLQMAQFTTDSSEREGLLEDAVHAAETALKEAERTCYPYNIYAARYTLSKALAPLAGIKQDQHEKERLLHTARELATEAIKMTKMVAPGMIWNEGVSRNFLADIESQLSELPADIEEQRNILLEAIANRETGLNLMIAWLSYQLKGKTSDPTYVGIGRWQLDLGTMLSRLYDMTGEVERLKTAAKIFLEGADLFQKLDLASLSAECHWRSAQVHDTLGEHIEASKEFILASEDYAKAVQKLPALESFYHDYSIYMQAWSEIEKARHQHEIEQYDSAIGYYEKAATLYSSTKRWSPLASNYRAWSRLEGAEDLSRKEDSEHALQAFKEAAGLFAESRAVLQQQRDDITLEEKEIAARLIRIAALREGYCRARIALEQAKLLDQKGDHRGSSHTYTEALRILEEVNGGLESQQDTREFNLIRTLTRAWEAMARAESEASPDMYLQASRFFDEAKELSPNERARTLTLGHSHFCRALEAGARFADTGNSSLHATAVQELESASKYYVRAGSKSASEYAKASKLLFDAYVYMNEASRETDQEKRAKLYALDEKVLEASASAYLKADYEGKNKQVLELLEKVKEDRELALSLMEILHAPTIVSTTTAFSTPSLTHGSASGLERFEHANVQGNLIAGERSLKVGEQLELELELVNVGKGPAQLIKLEEIIPGGFELAEKPESYRWEDGYLNLKGKRLDPLRTEEVKITLRAGAPGFFKLEPRLLYLDEGGKYKSYEPDPLELTVKELGVSGWLKGH